MNLEDDVGLVEMLKEKEPAAGLTPASEPEVTEATSTTSSVMVPEEASKPGPVVDATEPATTVEGPLNPSPYPDTQTFPPTATTKAPGYMEVGAGSAPLAQQSKVILVVAAVKEKVVQ